VAEFEPVGFLLVGVGGHAHSHLATLEDLQREGLVRLVGVYDADRARCGEVLQRLEAEGVFVADSLERLLEAGRGRAEVVAAPVGIPAHRAVSEKALRAGYHLVVEKPPAGCIQDVDAMIDACRSAGRLCAVHFQNIWSRTLQEVKRVLLSGEIGRLLEVRCKGRWLRTDAYYNRNGWAGRLRVNSTWVLDGTINNPFAHQINNGLFLAGGEMHRWAEPVAVRAELYRARSTIEGDDTACLEVLTEGGVVLRFWFTLCSGEPEPGPVLKVIGERGEIIWAVRAGPAEVKTAAGVRTLPADPTPPSRAVYGNVCRYLRGKDERVACTVADTRPFMLTVCAAYESAGPPHALPAQFVESAGEGAERRFLLKDIDRLIEECFATGAMFSDLGVPWAVRREQWQIPSDYRFFESAWAH